MRATGLKVRVRELTLFVVELRAVASQLKFDKVLTRKEFTPMPLAEHKA
jgi:hypothetical protein